MGSGVLISGGGGGGGFHHLGKASGANRSFVGQIKNGLVVFLRERQRNHSRQGLENGDGSARDGRSCAASCEFFFIYLFFFGTTTRSNDR